MNDQFSKPKGDSFGTLGETVTPLRLKARLPRPLRERQLCLLVVTAGTLLTIADVTVVSVALPSIITELGLSSARAVGVLSAFLVPFGALLVLAARLGELLGRRQLFVGGMGLLGLAGLVVGLADDVSMVIAGRVLQGAGAGLATGTAIRTITENFPRPRELLRGQAFHALVLTVGTGPLLLLGAALVHASGWRAPFLVFAPLALVIAVLGQRFVDEDEVDAETVAKLDLVGPGLLLVGSLLAVHALVEAATGGWTSWRGPAVALLAACVAALLVRHHVRATRAEVEARLHNEVLRMASVLGLAAMGWTAVLYLGASQLQLALGYSAWMAGLALLAAVVTRTLATLQLVPRLLRRVGSRVTTSLGLAVLAAGLVLSSVLPADAGLAIHLLLPLALAGLGMAMAASTIELSITAKTSGAERDHRIIVATAAQHLVAGVGVAALLSAGVAAPIALVGGLVLLATAVLAAVFVQPLDRPAPTELDPGDRLAPPKPVDLRGAVDADMVALGLGGTNMLGMLWTIAMGRRAVGVELRGSPTPSTMHWSLHEDLWHHLAEIDRMMIERYGMDRIPRRGDGEPFILHECFFNPSPDSTGDARADEVITGFIPGSHVAGLVQAFERIDDRWVDGEPMRTVEAFGPATRPERLDPARIGRGVDAVLRDRAAFQVGAQEVLVLLRRYLTEMERMDLASDVEPRCRIFTYHRVLETPDGLAEEAGGRRRIRIEAVRELDDKLGYRRIRVPGTDVIDLGVPELFVVAEGLVSTDAARLGFRQEPVTIDRQDGRGPVIAQADYLVGLMTMYVGSQCRKRIASEFDREGNEYWTRQVAIGHEEDGEIGWFVAEVPDFRTFDPIIAGLVPPGTERASAEYFAGYDFLVREYFLDQVSLITEVPRHETGRISVARQPTLVSVVVRVGVDAKVATNGVVMGDSFGCADFLTSHGINTAMIGHASRVLGYWQARAAGTAPEAAIRTLADAIEQDTRHYVQHSLPEFQQPPRPVAADEVLRATREHRRSALAVNYRDDWSRIQVFVGRLHTHTMPSLHPLHPARRPEDPMQPAIPSPAANSPQPIDVEERYGRFGHRRAKREQDPDEQRPTAS
jgi:MFS family permease